MSNGWAHSSRNFNRLYIAKFSDNRTDRIVFWRHRRLEYTWANPQGVTWTEPTELTEIKPIKQNLKSPHLRPKIGFKDSFNLGFYFSKIKYNPGTSELCKVEMSKQAHKLYNSLIVNIIKVGYLLINVVPT